MAKVVNSFFKIPNIGNVLQIAKGRFPYSSGKAGFLIALVTHLTFAPHFLPPPPPHPHPHPPTTTPHLMTLKTSKRTNIVSCSSSSCPFTNLCGRILLNDCYLQLGFIVLFMMIFNCYDCYYTIDSN